MIEERKLLNVYKGILDIFQALEKAKNAEEVMELYAEYLKLQVQLSTNYPMFETNPEGFKYGNCYTYVLDLKCPNLFWNKIKSLDIYGMGFDVGFLGTKYSKMVIENNSGAMLLDNFYKDMEFLNVKVYDSGLNELPKHSGYMILMYKDRDIRVCHNYHFLRLNSNVTLSHQGYHNGPIRSLPNIFSVYSKYQLVEVFEIVKPVIRERGL